jgi:tRNA(adenine34) deaminase
MDYSQEQYMEQALALAEKAFTLDEVPIGAVVVSPEGVVIGRGYNQVEQRHQQSAHAEVLAINEASLVVQDWRLEKCWIYVTLEPCMMCMMLIKLSRMDGVVYGASSPLFGYSQSSQGVVPLYNNRKSLTIVSGVMKEETAAFLKLFFQKKRM